MFSDGDVGVSFFFVLSGFLITYLLIKEKEFTGKIHLREFYIRRILRIWPLYYFTVLFGFLIFPLIKSLMGGTPNEIANPYLCSLFLNNFDRIYNGQPDSSLLSRLWSVAIEEQFYLVWPILFMLFSSRRYLLIFISVILFSLLSRVYYLDNPLFEFHTFVVISDMAIGGLGAYLIINNNRFLELITNLSRKWIIFVYALAFAFIIFKQEIFSHQIMLVLKRVIMGVTFIFIILEQNFSNNSLFKMGEWKLISQWGKYTYGLYCLHGIGILISVTLLAKLSLNQYGWQLWLLELPFSFVLSIMIAKISFKYFESRFLSLKEKFSFLSAN